jgi:D-3-phosphoglycerate dehydrogenase / 2-oxoglutarate reductase
MYTIQLLNKISAHGTKALSAQGYTVTDEHPNPDAIVLRSYDMHELTLPKSLKAVARAGAGVNNIPIDKCTQKGIVVFNTPGANANAVKELTLASLLLSSRRIAQGISWVQSQNLNKKIAEDTEKAKSEFVGPEIKGKTLGVIGLGAIGAMVANDAIRLGMKVIGYDPYISVDTAWEISAKVTKANDIEQVLKSSDYLTIHVPKNNKTTNLIDKAQLKLMKRGARIINLSRNGIVNKDDIIEALNSKHISSYVTDFPEPGLVQVENAVCIPHLGASTPEAEENCAVMATEQLIDFLETGNIVNSVNFPECILAQTADNRILVANENVPSIVGQVTSILAKKKINISDMLHRLRGDLGYIMIDVDGKVNQETEQEIRSIKGVLMTRVIPNKTANSLKE